MKTAELTKIYTGSTTQVAAEQRWSQGNPVLGKDEGMTVLAKLLQGHDLTVSKRDPAKEAADVTDSSRG